jgi:hypothetical protein
LENIIRKGYNLATIVDPLGHVFFAKNVDSLLVERSVSVVVVQEGLWYLMPLSTIFQLHQF